MTKIVDNKEARLADVLNQEFADLDEIAIASAYFNIRGYGAIAEGLADKPMKLLLGREPTETIKWEDQLLQEIEQYEDNSEYYQLLQKTIQYFQDEKRQIRTIEGKFFHGKAYVAASPNLTEVKRGVAVVGSSNFTYGGLVTNRELNMINTDREVVQQLSSWFQEQWNTATDFKQQFLTMLSNYVTSWSPYEIVAKALYETYKAHILEKDPRLLKTLYPHQQLTYIDAKEKLEKYGGVIIADSTGLGKSRVGLSLAHEYIRQGIRPLLIAPKAILDTTWEKEMNETLVRIEKISTEMLSHNPEIINQYTGEKGPKLIIIDEAHYFRRPSTNRYEALQKLITQNNVDIVFITATPINTSLMDLYHLMSLYLPDDAIADMGHNSLSSYFTTQQKKWLANEPINMDDVLRRFIVRHSRELAKALDTEGKIKFPTRKFDEKIKRYPIKISLQEIYEQLENLNLAFYDLSIERLAENFQLPDGTKITKIQPIQIENLKKLVKTIFQINLFKRLESSYEAFKQTLNRLQQYIDIATYYAEKHKTFIPTKMKGDIIRLIDEDDDIETTQLPKPEQLFNNPKYIQLRDKCQFTAEEAQTFIQKCRQDKKIIQNILQKLPHEDEKYQIFQRRIAEITKEIKEPNGIIIFTQYADTANYLYEQLKTTFKNVKLVTGSGGIDENGKRLAEDEVVARFQEKGGILVSTDVLAAGQNLQNAQYVANYDFPWNPVVLIQRVGRIDRIGSPYNEVYLLNVLPRNGNPEDPESIEYFIRLMQRLYHRLEMIRETIGLDASTLGEEAAIKDFSLQAMIARNDATVLDILEKRLEQFTKDPIDTLAKILREKGREWIEKIPDGIGAVKDADFEGLFTLFTDGQNFYWRLTRYDTGKTTTSPTEIVDILMQGDNQKKGENINYQKIIPLLQKEKTTLKQQLEEQWRRKITITGPLKPDKKTRQIYDALATQGPEGEKLAATFRNIADNKRIVDQLWKAYLNNQLLEKAREILTNTVKNLKQENEQKPPEKPRRICWCYIRKTNTTS
ncbi:MAG: helicase-related protein [Candidatus Caldarchaeum sp.]|nr:helicase-related protein [Candidatus Caldarchaeum sp.]MDW8435891.1 helicase-related protein [Candidatus Caldarchaeum sp.]